MSQTTSSLYSILSHPFIYNLFQKIIGSNKASTNFISSYVRLSLGDNILDVGCGTGEILKYFPESVHYYGIDLSPEYISSAKRKFGERNAYFYCSDLTGDIIQSLPKPDIVLAIGLLHHLDDSAVTKLMTQIKNIKHGSATFITIDPCYVENQSFISRWFVSHDRGNNVREINQYADLAKGVFDDVTLIHRKDLLNIPYDHAITISR